MEVPYECSNNGEIMGIESREGRAPLCWNGGMDLGVKGETPDLGTSGFLPTTEDDRVILKKTVTYFFKEDAGVVVAQFANAHQVVTEVRNYVAVLDGDIREEQGT